MLGVGWIRGENGRKRGGNCWGKAPKWGSWASLDLKKDVAPRPTAKKIRCRGHLGGTPPEPGHKEKKTSRQRRSSRGNATRHQKWVVGVHQTSGSTLETGLVGRDTSASGEERIN